MSELTVSQLIKIIIGVFVVIAVVTGAYFIFKDNFFRFFDSLPGSEPVKFILGMFK